MKKSLLLSFLLAGGMLPSYAQDKTTSDQVSVMPRQKRLEHQVGVQMNELIRQVFNFNSGTQATPANPYLLTYTVTHRKTGVGLRLGGGYSQRSFADDDGVNARDGDITNMNIRAGLEKSFQLSDKWTTGVGADFVFADDNNNTKNLLKSADTTTTIVNSRINSMGGGAMAWLRYSINRNILIGTEASFYYRMGRKEQTIEVTKRDFSTPSRPWVTNYTRLENNESEGAFSMPVVFYLIVRF